jgi:hypothetical protein
MDRKPSSYRLLHFIELVATSVEYLYRFLAEKTMHMVLTPSPAIYLGAAKAGRNHLKKEK